MDCGLGVQWDRNDSRRNPRRAVASGQTDAKFIEVAVTVLLSPADVPMVVCPTPRHRRM